MRIILPILLMFSAVNLSAQKDIIPTEDGELVLTPILHATMVMEWDGKTIYIDPYGGAERFDDFKAPDLVIITHKHGDHLHAKTLGGLSLEQAELIAPQSVVEAMGEISFGKVTSLKNGETTETLGLKVHAIPMYNLPETDDSRHPKGWGNGYVMEIGGKRFYISGDTEDIREMRALKNIDYAFVCMNLPYTMDIKQASSAVLEFKPKVVYPFHYRGGGGKFSDVEAFKGIVNEGDSNIEVRLRNWYPEQ
jgi:L-ascorbate metabolism protein UlaG (beta-lactamase superfamily)